VLCIGAAQAQEARGVLPAQAWTENPAPTQLEFMPTYVQRGVSDWEAATALAADYLRQLHADVDHDPNRPDNADNGWSWEGTESPDDPDDAGWDWVLTSPPDPFHHSTGSSPVNLYGPCGLGVYDAYVAMGSSDAALLRVMQEVADYSLTRSRSCSC
jgi:hypothetical protein